MRTESELGRWIKTDITVLKTITCPLCNHRFKSGVGQNRMVTCKSCHQTVALGDSHEEAQARLVRTHQNAIERRARSLDNAGKPTYRCMGCFHEVDVNDDKCPNCGVILSGIKCANCGQISGEKEYISNGHRCPKCGSKKKEDGIFDCFIATAVYGNTDCPEVLCLRIFRDEVLCSNKLGRVLVYIYYSLSPPLARWLTTKPRISLFIRRFAIAPLVHIVRQSKVSNRLGRHHKFE